MSTSGFYVDLGDVVRQFHPRISREHYYGLYPKLRNVMDDVTVQRVIECVFLYPSTSLHENGLTGLLWEYIEHNCETAMLGFEADSDLIYAFECLSNDITERTDQTLRCILSPYGVGYENFVFDHWAAESLAAFYPVQENT